MNKIKQVELTKVTIRASGARIKVVKSQKMRRLSTPVISLTLLHNLLRVEIVLKFNLFPPKTQAMAIVWKMRNQNSRSGPQG